MKKPNDSTRDWYDKSYLQSGFAAQRLYPNEELLRFFGRHYFSLSASQKSATRVLEMGCGSGGNLWMIAREGFDAHGIDLSTEAIGLCRMMLEHWDASATLTAASMTDCPYQPNYFDVVVDVFSSYCLNEIDFAVYLDEMSRLLKPGGRYFSYTPSKASDAFRNPWPSRHIDASTLDGIHRETSSFFGNSYPFRFITPDEYEAALVSRGLSVNYKETVGRTYSRGGEYFEFVVIVAEQR